MTFSLDKCERDENGHWKAQTRDGRLVRILCADAKNDCSLIGLVELSDDKESAWSWTAEGNSFKHCPHHHDLIVPPRKRTVTVEIWVRKNWNGESEILFRDKGRIENALPNVGFKLVDTFQREIEV